MLRAMVLAAALAGTGAPAFAQSLASPGETTTALEDAMTKAFLPCFNLGSESTTPPATKAEVCAAGLAELDQVVSASKTPLTERELNTKLALRAQLHSRLGGHYIRIDGVRSKRACDQVEANVADITSIKGEQLAGFRQVVPQLAESAKSMARTCRADFGTPSGAPSVD